MGKEIKSLGEIIKQLHVSIFDHRSNWNGWEFALIKRVFNKSFGGDDAALLTRKESAEINELFTKHFTE